MENKDNGLTLVLGNILNNKNNTMLLQMLNIIYTYTNNPNNKVKLTTLDDLLSWRKEFLQFVLTVKNESVLKNSKWVDYVSKCGVTGEMIKHPEFHLKWIVRDTEYECVLNNWTKNCKVENIKLDKLDLNEKNLVELGTDDNFIKICKMIDRLIVNNSLRWKRDNINNGGNKGLLNCVFGNESYKIFFEAIAKIEWIGEYFDEIDRISCKDKEFQDLQQKLKQAKVKLTIKNGSIVAEDYDHEKQKNEINEINNNIKEDKNEINEINNNIKEDKNEGKNGLLWFFGIVGAAGIGLGVASAINCYVTTFWAFLAFKGTAAVLSVAIPGGVGALFFAILILSLIYKRSATQNNGSIINNINHDMMSMEEDRDKGKDKDKGNIDEKKAPMQENGVEKNDIKDYKNNKSNI